MSLSESQIERYGRQLILPEVGAQGQQRLAQAKVLVIGAGGLGSPAALYLAAAGVGTLGLVDREAVELSNLHRQILHTTRDIGQPKTASAAARLTSLNPEVAVHALQTALSAENAAGLLAPYDAILDGADNLPTRYLVNDACVLLDKPLVHGGIVGFDGQLMTILPRRSACFRCVFPEPPSPGEIPSCQQAGVLGPVAGVIGALMAQEALKLLLGAGEPLAGRLLTFHGRRSAFREVPVRRDPGCAVCGDAPAIRTLQALEPVCYEKGSDPSRTMVSTDGV
ncbi:MAG: HesA/MoeB/ThiF family protein [Candidatus Omnitrophica bacterium]|nr:HesA/MoeB/ThiF family protein [Candidatus Omnitrophota bacterium]